MPSIAKCSGEGCEVRGECYRFTSKPVEWQVWFVRPPRDERSCLWIIPIEKGEVYDSANHIAAA